MATSLPWSVKGVDPRTRDAAKAAARRAGMTLGEWLDHKIRDEAAEQPAPRGGEKLEQLDIAALSDRLSRLAQNDMETSSKAAESATGVPGLSREQITALLGQAAAAERVSRESTQKTAGALDSIARWIEKTEQRIVASERASAERQERATVVIAEAIKTMGERLNEIDRKATGAQRAAEKPQARAAALSRESLSAAVSDIRSRQRALDDEPARAAPAVDQQRLAGLRDDLRTLQSRMAAVEDRDHGQRQRPVVTPPAPPVDLSPLQSMLADLGSRIDRVDSQKRIEAVLTPLARIEADLARLTQERPDGSFTRFEQEISHLAGRIDALAARGTDRTLLAPVLRDIAEVRDLVASANGSQQLDDLSGQVASLSSELVRLREVQPDGRELRSLALAVEDVREAILAERGGGSQLAALSRQVESLAGRIDSLPALHAQAISGQADELAQRFAALGEGRGASHELKQSIEALVARLDDFAARQPTDLDARFDALKAHIEGLARQDGAAGISRQIEALAARQPHGLGDRLDALQDRLDALADKGPAAIARQIDALGTRIEGLAASANLARIVQDGDGPVARVDLTPIEQMLRGLAEKIDEAGRPSANADSFDALENQIAGLAARLDEAAATRNAESGIERTLQDLVVHLRSLREDTAAAAERAARAALADIGDRGGESRQGLAELSTLVSGLRDTSVSSDRKTQDALDALHRTLETMMSRLSGLETEIADSRRARPVPPALSEPSVSAPARFASAPSAAVSVPVEPAPASVAPPERSLRERMIRPAAPAVSPAAEAAFDMPLEPGSGRPVVEAGTVSAQDPQSLRQNLIAAARRSAKAATDAAASTAPAPEAGDKKSPGGRLKEIAEKRRRPLLLGLAALVLAMGAAHVVTGAFKGGQPAPTVTQSTPGEPSLTAPVKDQTSAVRDSRPEAVAALPADETKVSVAPDLAAPPAVDVTGSTPPAGEQVAVLPPPSAADAVKAVTDIGTIPATLGTPGLRKAAQSGDARAVYELASRAADGPSRDPKLALRLFERAAVAGLAPAQFRVGNMFEKGVGAPADLGLARVWYTRAAEQGNAKAMHNLAVLYAEGITGKPDYATATDWFRRAAEHGVRDSQYNLAILLGRGLGTKIDLAQSYKWFAIAAAQGDTDAGSKRDEVGARLAAPELAAAKAAVESWRPQQGLASVNEVTAPARGWDEPPSAATRKPPVKPSRG